MLNDYHLQFVRRLQECNVRYLVIGGQARFTHFGDDTRDLDIWVDLSPSNIPHLERCLVEWSAAHPMHTATPLSRPLGLRRNLQIKFPDADVWYLNSNGEPAEIVPADRIDILTSIGEADFETFYLRCVCMPVHGVEVSFVGPDDIATLAAYRR